MLTSEGYVTVERAFWKIILEICLCHHGLMFLFIYFYLVDRDIVH